MNIVKTNVEDVIIIEPKVFGDHRGWFTETYSKEKFKNMELKLTLFKTTTHFLHKKVH